MAAYCALTHCTGIKFLINPFLGHCNPWFIFFKLIFVGALLLLLEAVYLGKIDSSSILWSKICGLYLKEVSIQEGFIIAQKRYVLSAKQQPLKKTLPLLKLSYQIEFTYCFIVNLWVKEIF